MNDHQEKELNDHDQSRTEALFTVDEIVEEIYNTLKDSGKLKNTYIIYSSDNGFHLGQYRLGSGKKFLFKEITNVTFILRGPGVPAGRKTSIVTAHVDLSPTKLDMAEIEQRADFDGGNIPITDADLTTRENSDADEYANVEFWEGASFILSLS